MKELEMFSLFKHTRNTSHRQNKMQVFTDSWLKMSNFIVHRFNIVKESVIKIMDYELDWCGNIPYRTSVHSASPSHSFWLWDPTMETQSLFLKMNLLLLKPILQLWYGWLTQFQRTQEFKWTIIQSFLFERKKNWTQYRIIRSRHCS